MQTRQTGNDGQFVKLITRNSLFNDIPAELIGPARDRYLSTLNVFFVEDSNCKYWNAFVAVQVYKFIMAIITGCPERIPFFHFVCVQGYNRSRSVGRMMDILIRNGTEVDQALLGLLKNGLLEPVS